MVFNVVHMQLRPQWQLHPRRDVQKRWKHISSSLSSYFLLQALVVPPALKDPVAPPRIQAFVVINHPKPHLPLYLQHHHLPTPDTGSPSSILPATTRRPTRKTTRRTSRRTTTTTKPKRKSTTTRSTTTRRTTRRTTRKPIRKPPVSAVNKIPTKEVAENKWVWTKNIDALNMYSSSFLLKQFNVSI